MRGDRELSAEAMNANIDTLRLTMKRANDVVIAAMDLIYQNSIK